MQEFYDSTFDSVECWLFVPDESEMQKFSTTPFLEKESLEWNEKNYFERDLFLHFLFVITLWLFCDTTLLMQQMEE